VILFAYYLGGLQPDQALPTAIARALNYQDLRGLCEALVRELTTGDAADLTARAQQAYGRLFAGWGLDSNASPAAKTEALNEMFEQLPEQWIGFAESMLEQEAEWAELDRSAFEGDEFAKIPKAERGEASRVTKADFRRMGGRLKGQNCR
jgi:hypothetical protein